LGGAVEEVVDLLLAAFFSVGSFALAAEGSSLATCLAAVAPKFFELEPYPTITEKDSKKRGRGGVFLGGTLVGERLPVSQPHIEGSVRLPLTLPKMGVWSPSGLPKTQTTIAGVKTPRIWGVLYTG
jgi:hypothetical protein